MTCHRCRLSRLPRVLVADVFWFGADTPEAARTEALRGADMLSADLGHPVSATAWDGTGRALGTALGSGRWAPLAVAAEQIPVDSPDCERCGQASVYSVHRE